MGEYFLCRALNVRGLQTDKKRHSVFFWLKEKIDNLNPSIEILTETHCHSRKDAKNWGNEWGNMKNSSFWSRGTSNSKGVCILFHELFLKAYSDLKILDKKIDLNGRYVKLVLNISNCTYRLLGVYAPNNPLERVRFFQDLFELVDDGFEAENIFGGDWNCVKNAIIDRKNCTGTNDIGQIDLEYLSQALELEDAWRRRYPDTLEYTWSRPDGKMSRLDYWLTSKSLSPQISAIFHKVAPLTDHRAINIVIKTSEIKRGRGLYKMNVSHLLNDNFKQEISELWGKWQQNKNRFPDKGTWWDTGKNHIKSYCISFAREFNIEKRQDLDCIEEKLDKCKKADADYERLKKEYENMLDAKADGARVRSRIQNWEEGEKSTKYFYNLEKQNAKEKLWTEIYDKNGKVINGTKDIQKRQLEFYENLYSSQNITPDQKEVDYFLDNDLNNNKLSESSKDYMDQDLSENEIKNAIKKMKNNKSPGTDGIAIEFYKLYWGLVGEDLTEVLIEGLENKQLAYSQYLASIILLYKKGPRPDIKNWRPISLLNVDYKILTKVFAERLKKVLPEIINQDQKGCIPGRYIGHNIRLISDIFHEMEEDELDSLILQLDQEKAFDRVEWNWLFSVLSHFNFGHRFIEILQTMYSGSRSCIMTNGYQSKFFNITRGIRQGDALSALLYVIQFEPLVNKIRNCNSIEGLKVKLNNSNREINTKGCQYVDDSNTILKNVDSIDPFLDVINKYEKVSGSKVNVDKTVCMAANENLSIPFPLKPISKDNKKVLGVPVGKDKINEAFWTKIIQKLKSKLNIWRMRSLSYIGKALIIRSQAISQISYAMEMIPIEDRFIKDINTIIFDFLWAGKNIKIKRNIAFLPRDIGGLNIVNVEILIKTKRIMWVIRALKEQTGQTWAKLVENYLRCLDNKFKISFFTLKVSDSRDLTKKAKIPRFYKECIHHFQLMNSIALQNSFQDEIIWCNRNRKFRNKPLTISHWAKSGIKQIGDLYTEGSIQGDNLKARLTHKAAFFFEISKIKQVFPENSINIGQINSEVIDGGKDFLLRQVYNIPGIGPKSLDSITSKDIYNILLLNNVPEIKSKTYWLNKFPGININFETWFLVNMNNPLVPNKTKDFSWKVFHGQINTGPKLKLMGFSPDEFCKICRNNMIENIEHLIYDCDIAHRVWLHIRRLLSLWLGENFTISKINAITGYWSSDISTEIMILNMFCCLTRHYIWKKRCAVVFDNQKITSEIQVISGLKWFILGHLTTLLASKNVDTNIKEIITNVKSLIDNAN